MTSTRRQRHRQAIFEEIRATARGLMGEHGTAGLSLRAIAREMDVTPAALYYYYPSVGDLITALIVEAFSAMSESLDRAVRAAGPSFESRAWALSLAYRDWALTHPTDFQLIYGNPIPGYQQPTDVTYPPARRGFALLAGLIASAVESGELVPPESARVLPDVLGEPLEALARLEGHGYPPAALYLAASVWARMHGLVMLELFHLIQPVVGDAEAFYRAETLAMLRQIGLRLA